jgi:hypothetical protein
MLSQKAHTADSRERPATVFQEMRMKDITPEHLRCCLGTCPGVYEIDADTVLVVARIATPDEIGEIPVGDNEVAGVIRKAFFASLKGDWQ